MKQLEYRWGYTVGVLFLLCAALLFVAVFVGEALFGSPSDCTVHAPCLHWIFGSLVFSLLPFLAGIGILWRKAIGWYFYCFLIASLMLLVLWGAITLFSVGIFQPSLVLGAVALALTVLLGSFLFVQVRYWRRRAPLYKRNKIAGIKQLDYNWGYTVGVLLVIAAWPALAVTELLFDSRVLATGFALLVAISGVAVFRRKALGWYLYFGWLSLFILACAGMVFAHLIMIPIFERSLFIMWLSCMSLASLFLYRQIRYWRRRAPLYNRNTIAV
jgi:hypothetical protein